MTGAAGDPADPVRDKVLALQGPVVVLGASGFVGANLLRTILRHRPDAVGTASSASAWRLEGLPEASVFTGDLLVEENVVALFDAARPRTVFNCLAYGAYSFQTDPLLIYRTNVDLTVRLVREMQARGIHRYVHAGSSSEYGDDASGPDEDAALHPNSHYSVTKGCTAGLLHYLGRKEGFPGVNLRLYSVYGPYEDSSRLVPVAVMNGIRGQSSSFVAPDISRDFLYVDDCCEAFFDAALNLSSEDFGASFNVGSGTMTTIGDFAAVVKEMFSLAGETNFSMPSRGWDVSRWYANPARARERLGWEARTPLREGLGKMADWCRGLGDTLRYEKSSKKFGLDETWSVSAIVACYKDGQAIPHMHARLTETFVKLGVDYEIIFVNDNSPDDSEEVIRVISARDRRVVGISHSRNFGSQSAFRSGMEIATKNACVLLDGDLQDPPELIEQFVAGWKAGNDVVYGRRVKRDAPWYMEVAYKGFYRVFQRFSYVPVPRDAGDFSLMSRSVVQAILAFPERDLFMRGLRAFVGYRQAGVDYTRPERMFGTSTNNLLKNIGWAKKGILSFSNTPLNILTAAGLLMSALSAVLVAASVAARFLFPASAPRGYTSMVLIVSFFGSFNILAISLIGEYVAKIFEEVKRRPHFVRRHFIRDGEVRAVAERARLPSVQAG